MAAALVYAIWDQRNMRRFRGKSRDVAGVKELALHLVQSRNSLSSGHFRVKCIREVQR